MEIIADGKRYTENPKTVVVSKDVMVILYQPASSRSKRSADEQASGGQERNIVFTFGTGSENFSTFKY